MIYVLFNHLFTLKKIVLTVSKFFLYIFLTKLIITDISNQITQLFQRSDEPQNAHEVHYLVSEAKQYLNSTHHRDNLIEKSLNYAKKNAEDAEKLLKEILSKKLDDKEYQQLFQKYNEFNIIVKNFRNALWDRSNADSVNAKHVAHIANEKLLKLKNVISDIVDLNEETQNDLTVSNDVADEIKNSISNVRSIFEVYCYLFFLNDFSL